MSQSRRGEDSGTSEGFQEPENIATELTGFNETEAIIDVLEQRRERLRRSSRRWADIGSLRLTSVGVRRKDLRPYATSSVEVLSAGIETSKTLSSGPSNETLGQ
jgi:hypothetical protein